MVKITEFLPYTENNETLNQCYLAITTPYYVYMIVYTTIIIFIPTIFLTFLYLRMIFMLKISYRVNFNEVYMPKLKNLINKSSADLKQKVEINSQSFSEKSDLPVEKNPSMAKIENKCRFYKFSNRHKKKLNKAIRITIKSNDDSSSSLINSQKLNIFKKNQSSFHNINLNRDIGKLSQLKALNMRKRFTITILSMTVAFFCCQLPIRIFILWSFSYQLRQSSSIEYSEINYELINIISFVARLIYFLHGISNPLIYNISSSKFRHAFLSLFCISKRFKK